MTCEMLLVIDAFCARMARAMHMCHGIFTVDAQGSPLFFKCLRESKLIIADFRSASMSAVVVNSLYKRGRWIL